MAWVLILLGTLGPAVLAEELPSQQACLELARQYRPQLDARAGRDAQMWCMGVEELDVPMMTVPGKNIAFPR